MIVIVVLFVLAGRAFGGNSDGPCEDLDASICASHTDICGDPFLSAAACLATCELCTTLANTTPVPITSTGPSSTKNSTTASITISSTQTSHSSTSPSTMAPTSTSPSTTASISTAPFTSTPDTTTKHSTTPTTITSSTSTTRTSTSSMPTSSTATASMKPTPSHTTSTFPSSTSLSYTQKCDAAGYHLLSTGDTHLCMHLKHNKHSWSNAEKVCEREHARLVVLDTQEKVEAFRHILDGNDYWIGATDDDHDDNFSWVTGVPISATFWLWGHGEPDGRHQFCVILNGHDHKMHDRACADSHRSVCEIPL